MLDISNSLAARRATLTSAIWVWWGSHRITVLRLACALMALLAALKLGEEFRRLLFDPGYNGAVDTRILNQLARGWFDGKPLYKDLVTAVYPPASYVLLWPLLGWLEFTSARWLWAITSVAALAWLVYLIVQESGADTRLEYIFVALLPLSMNATGVTIGNGQLIVHILPTLLFTLLLLRDSRGERRVRLLAVSLFVLTLVKPTISAPFLWIVLFVGGGLLTILLVILGYAGLTLFALPFQTSTPAVLAQEWTERAAVLAATGGYANLHKWLASIDRQEWTVWLSLLIFAVLGYWIYQHRKGDFWILLGVTAIVARLWSYHRVYDDVLILLPMVALFRVAKREPSTDDTRIVAGLLLAVTIASMLALARWEHFAWPWSILFKGGHTLVWIMDLGFLLFRAHRDKKAEV